MMSIKFITEEVAAGAEHTLGDVEVDQFFISGSGALCQKVNKCAYNIIAHPSGAPYASRSGKDGVGSSFHILSILPEVTKIEF